MRLQQEQRRQHVRLKHGRGGSPKPQVNKSANFESGMPVQAGILVSNLQSQPNLMQC